MTPDCRLQNVILRPSPSFGVRKNNARPAIIVIHFTGMDGAEAACERLCDPEIEVSAHYLVGEAGDITQMVAERDRAWHAGAGSWRGIEDVNSWSIGIELDNNGARPFAEAQMVALYDLVADIMARQDIAAANVIGHSDLAPGRKFDPGPWFDWRAMARRGLARELRHFEYFQPLSPEEFKEIAAQAGYTANARPEAVLQAVRLRAGLYPFDRTYPEREDFAAVLGLGSLPVMAS